MASIRPAPIFSLADYIYPGPHIDSSGRIDDRTWFAILINRDPETMSDTYLVFPYGGREDEITEVVSEGTSLWTG